MEFFTVWLLEIQTEKYLACNNHNIILLLNQYLVSCYAFETPLLFK
jgi:hypothetical protein